ncbi:MAG: c-type cytochrome [Actinobacteria bacterium]|nr:c-type cytochrome [Actinomycetota bacterium]MBO0836026.1 c-type cytochrome [Actinomycetota bacterium]
MSWITARRRHPVAGFVVIAFVLVIIGTAYAVITGASASAAPKATPSSAQIAEGRNLFVQDCSTCHGLFAEGSSQAPSLIGVGAAAVSFQVSTGRMPAAEQGAQNDRKPPRLNPAETAAIAAYIQSLGGGPTVPSAAQVSTSGANIGLGQQLFVADCAACHNFVGAGGALTYGKAAPPLTSSTPTQIYEAMQTGPEAMPVFNDLTITPKEKRDIIAYVTHVRAQPNPGGFSLGRVGPVTEGLVAFLGLLLFMVLAALWITAKHGKAHE